LILIKSYLKINQIAQTSFLISITQTHISLLMSLKSWMRTKEKKNLTNITIWVEADNKYYLLISKIRSLIILYWIEFPLQAKLSNRNMLNSKIIKISMLKTKSTQQKLLLINFLPNHILTSNIFNNSNNNNNNSFYSNNKEIRRREMIVNNFQITIPQLVKTIYSLSKLKIPQTSTIINQDVSQNLQFQKILLETLCQSSKNNSLFRWYLGTDHLKIFHSKTYITQLRIQLSKVEVLQLY
jgi:hypothetical protein